MTKTLTVNSQQIDLEFIDQANCWRTNVQIDNEEIEIEIDFQFHKGETVDWDHFTSFFRFINESNRLKSYVRATSELVLSLAQTIFQNMEETKEWEVAFSNTIYYNGKTGNNYSFSLVFDYGHPSKGLGDDYGIYLVEYSSNILTGVKRHQC